MNRLDNYILFNITCSEPDCGAVYDFRLFDKLNKEDISENVADFDFENIETKVVEGICKVCQDTMIHKYDLEYAYTHLLERRLDIQ